MISKIGHKLRWFLYRVLAVIKSTTSVKIDNITEFTVNNDSTHNVMRAKTFFTKEPECVKWLSNFEKELQKDDFVFFDIGANIGIYSLFVAKKFPKAKIVSFEPECLNFSALCKHLRLNTLKNILAYPFGVSNVSTVSELNVSVFETGAGAASLESDYKFTKQNEKFVQGVYTTSLDDFVLTKKDYFPSFIKIDTDGNELSILDGAKSILGDPRLKSILIEFEYKSEQEEKNFIKRFHDYGLNLIGKSDWCETAFYDKSIKIQNFIFSRV